MLTLSRRARRVLTIAVLPAALALVAAGCASNTTPTQPTKAGFGDLHLNTVTCYSGNCIPKSQLSEAQARQLSQHAASVRAAELELPLTTRKQLLAGYRIDNALTAPDTIEAVLQGEAATHVTLHRNAQYTSALEAFEPAGPTHRWVGYVATSLVDAESTADTFDADFGTDGLPLDNHVQAQAITGMRIVSSGAAFGGFQAASDPITCTDVVFMGGLPTNTTCAYEEIGATYFNENVAAARTAMTLNQAPVRVVRLTGAGISLAAGATGTAAVDLGVALPGEEQRDLTVAASLNVAGSASVDVTAVHAASGVTHTPLVVSVAPAASVATSDVAVTVTVRADDAVIRTFTLPVHVIGAAVVDAVRPAAAEATDTKSPIFTFVKAYATTSAKSLIGGLVQQAKTSEAGTVTGVLANALPANGLDGRKKRTMVNVYATGKMTVSKPGVFSFKFTANDGLAVTIAPRKLARSFPARMSLTITDKSGNSTLIRRIVYVKIAAKQ